MIKKIIKIISVVWQSFFNFRAIIGPFFDEKVETPWEYMRDKSITPTQGDYRCSTHR
jgi:hypothetical protein